MSTRHIVYMDLSALTPAEVNPKEHDLQALVSSMDRFGFIDPVLLDERTGRLIAGHGRKEALIFIRERDGVPPAGVFIDDDGEWLVPVLRGWSSRNDTEAAALLAAVNQIPMSGGWNVRSYAQLLEDIITEDASLMESIGMTADDIDTLLAQVNPETLNERDPDLPERTWNDEEDDDSDDEDDEDDVGEQSTVLRTGRDHTCPSCGYEWSTD